MGLDHTKAGLAVLGNDLQPFHKERYCAVHATSCLTEHSHDQRGEFFTFTTRGKKARTKAVAAHGIVDATQNQTFRFNVSKSASRIIKL